MQRIMLATGFPERSDLALLRADILAHRSCLIFGPDDYVRFVQRVSCSID